MLQLHHHTAMIFIYRDSFLPSICFCFHQWQAGVFVSTNETTTYTTTTAEKGWLFEFSFLLDGPIDPLTEQRMVAERFLAFCGRSSGGCGNANLGFFRISQLARQADRNKGEKFACWVA